MAKRPTRFSDLPPLDTAYLHPRIPGDVDNVDAGVGLHHVEHGLLLHMDRPDATPRGSVFRLFWSNTNAPVATKIIQEGDENLKRIPFTVPADKIHEHYGDPVYVLVTRPAGGNELKTLPLRLRVNLRRPGGQDMDPAPGHQKLVFELPADVVLYGLSDERAKLGVEVLFRHWENMAAYDQIFLAWGSALLTRLILPHEVDTDVTITVDYETILDAGNNELMPIAYRVVGPTGNKNDPWAPWSAVFRLPVYLDAPRLPPPWLEFPDTPPTIDLDTLGAQDVSIGVWVNATDGGMYSHIFLIWAGMDAEGGSVPYTASRELPSGKTYYFPIPNALVQAIAKGRAVVHYLLKGDQRPDKLSDKLYLNVLGEVVRWPAPTIDQAPGPILDPNMPKATVRFPAQPSWDSTDLLTITLLAVGPDTIEYTDDRAVGQIPPGGEMTFEVPGSELKRFDGRVMTAHYSVRRGIDEPRSSLRGQWQVGEPARDMPEPRIEKEMADQLDPDDVLNGAKVTATFTGTKRMDWITLYWVGPVISAPPQKFQVAVEGNTVNFEILIDYITPNLMEQVSCYYTLERDKEPTRYSYVNTVLIARGLETLPAPELSAARSTGPGTATLAPLDALTGSDLVVRYTGMLATDDIKALMVGTPGAGSPDIPSKPGNAATGEVIFRISREAIAANIGNANKTVTFKYLVTRNGIPKNSDTLTVTVTPIPVAELQKTVIRINEADPETRILDLSKVTDGATLHIGKWPFITAPWPVWLYLKGKKNDLDHIHTSFDGNAGAFVNPGWVSAGYFEYPIPASYLKELDHGSTLTMEFSAAVSDSQVKADAIVFQPVAYFVRKAPALIIDESVMVLNGRAIVTLKWARNGQDFPGNAQTRTASGGVLPLTYTPKDPAIVTVTSNGKVTGMKNGRTTIEVMDRAGSVAAYDVVVSNVWLLRENQNLMNWSQAIAWRNTLPGALGIYFADGIRLMGTVYGWPLPVPNDPTYWLCVQEGCDALTGVRWDRTQPDDVWCASKNWSRWAWCLQPS